MKFKSFHSMSFCSRIVHELVFKKPLNFDLAAPLGQQSMTYIKQEPWRLPSRQAEFNGTDRLGLDADSDDQAGSDWKPKLF